jgi:hypothetical protein
VNNLTPRMLGNMPPMKRVSFLSRHIVRISVEIDGRVFDDQFHVGDPFRFVAWMRRSMPSIRIHNLNGDLWNAYWDA